MASNSRPSSSICWSLSRASGLSIMLGIRAPSVSVSQGDLDGAFGGVDAGAHDLADAARHLAGAQVEDLAGAQRADARVADPHPAAVGQRRAGLLAGDEDRQGAVAGRLDVAGGEADRAALAELAVALADDGLKALDVQAVALTLALPVLGSWRRASRRDPRGRPRARASPGTGRRAGRGRCGRRRRASAPASQTPGGGAAPR